MFKELELIAQVVVSEERHWKETLFLFGVIAQGGFCLIGAFLWHMFKVTLSDLKEWLSSLDASVSDFRENCVRNTTCEKTHEIRTREIQLIMAPIVQDLKRLIAKADDQTVLKLVEDLKDRLIKVEMVIIELKHEHDRITKSGTQFCKEAN